MNSDRRAVACAAVLFAFTATAAEPTAEEILSGTAATADYSEAVKCITSAKIDRTEPLNDRYIVFHLNGDQLWLAQFKVRCPGMTSHSQLSFEKDEHRLCAWDSVRVVTEDGIGGFRLGPRCNLPKFEPVSQEQVDMLKQHIRNPGPKRKPPEAE
jgi:hypothetical protein